MVIFFAQSNLNKNILICICFINQFLNSFILNKKQPAYIRVLENSDMDIFRKNFGATFRRIRKSKNLTQDEVAERAGLSISYISDVERGVANPKLDTIEALAKGVDVGVQELFNLAARMVTPDDVRQRIADSLATYDDKTIEAIYQRILNIVSK